MARTLVNDAERGFDVFVTEDGERWDAIVRDGAHDSYNYGARTFTVCNDELFVGTANPYYGAQLWKIVPPEEGNELCHRLVDHGRAVCTARTKPHCEECCLSGVCQKNL